MAEFWTETHLRGQQTIAVWSRFAPTFTVGSLTLTAFTADVAQILTLVNLRDVQQEPSESGSRPRLVAAPV